jgi:hypothetical protein
MTYPISHTAVPQQSVFTHGAKPLVLIFTFLFSVFSACVATAAVAPLTVNGSQVQVGGVAKGLSGNSYFWSNDGWGAERFYNANVVSWLKTDWHANIVRAAMGVEDNGAYLQNPTANKNRVKAVVDAAIANDMYVIIDWHSHHAEDHQAAAVAFFTEMAQTYGQNNNVIYEIYNEPLQVSWSNTIKPYAEAVIAAIRAVDPDNLIIVGTPTWSQDVDKAAADPITGYSNIAYTLHFYAGTHKAWLRDRAERAMNAGIALVVTEWGTVNASGDGAVDINETNAWVNWMKHFNLTHLNWSISDKVEGASILKPGVSSNGNWSTNDLTQSGNFVRDIVRDYNDTTDPGDNPGGGSGSANCEIVISNQWNSGFVAEVRVTNSGTSAITQDWSVAFQFTGGSSVINSWNGQMTGSNPYSIAPLGYNKTIQPGNSTAFGIQVNKGTSGLPAQTPVVTGAICN